MTEIRQEFEQKLLEEFPERTVKWFECNLNGEYVFHEVYWMWMGWLLHKNLEQNWE